MLYKYYLKCLDYDSKPKFLNKYLKTPSLIRLKKVSYFCGMDYASKDVYNFEEYISRYDHSVSVALLTYKLTKNKNMTIAGLFHDISTPCFSHVIDYMNKDYSNQETTEEYTEKILKNDDYLQECLKENKIDINDIINFKQYSIVDNNRPKLCADRLDGIILTGIAWTKKVNKKIIDEITSSIYITQNEFGEEEIAIHNKSLAKKIVKISDEIDQFCHSNEDNYMMDLLSRITLYSINQNYITYKDLFIKNEEEIYNILHSINNIQLKEMIDKFENIKKEDIPIITLPNVKKRTLNPIADGLRLK